MKKKILVMLLCALLSGNILIGCGTEESSETDSVSNAVTETEETAPAETEIRDNLPDGLSFNGETSTFLYRAELLNEFFVDEESGDIVDASVYNSIVAVEDRLSVDIVVEAKEGHMASARAPYMDHIDEVVLSGDDVYDWVDLMIGQATIRLQNGIFMNLLDNPYIDIEKPWYLAKMDDMILADNLLFVSGDASLGYMKNAFVFYFNTETAANYQIDDLYTLVDEGKWTLDKLREITEKVSTDLNGDGNYTEDDQLGFLVHNYNHLTGFLGSTGVNMYTKDSDGVYTFTFGSDRDVAVCEKLYQILYNTQGSFDCNLSDTTESEVPAFNALTNRFMSGEILMMTAQLDEAVAYLRDMESPYGVLPYPKYDEEQSDYITLARSSHNSFSMPLTCSNPDRAGAVLEALSSEKYRSVLPVYYEKAMKVKYSRDNDSARMFDLIRDSLTLNFEFVYGQPIGNPALGVFRTCFSSENAVASTVAANKKILQTSLEKYIQNIHDKYNQG